jgi:hypothetical protein
MVRISVGVGCVQSALIKIAARRIQTTYLLPCYTHLTAPFINNMPKEQESFQNGINVLARKITNCDEKNSQ